MLYWNLFGLLGLLAMVALIITAVVVYLAAPHRSENRRLSVLLFMETVGVQVCAGLILFMGDPEAAYAMRALSAVAFIFLPISYMWFVATLRTPLVTPFRSAWVRWGLVLIGAGVIVIFYLRPELFVGEPTGTWYARWDVPFGPWISGFLYAAGAISVFGLVAALDVYRRSEPRSLGRRRARSYALAFGLRDLTYASFFFVLGPALMAGERWPRIVWGQGGPLLSMAYLSLLAYGILRSQILGIDLKVKWTLSRGTVAAVFVATFFAVSEIAAGLLSERMGLITGVLVTALLVFLMAPLQRVADLISDRAMPGVHDTDDYRARRQEEIYQGAIEELLADGAITGKERKTLFRLQRDLGLTPAEANALEERMIEGLQVARN